MSESPRREVRRLGWIMRHVSHLSPAGRAWLLARLTADAADHTTPTPEARRG